MMIAVCCGSDESMCVAQCIRVLCLRLSDDDVCEECSEIEETNSPNRNHQSTTGNRGSLFLSIYCYILPYMTAQPSLILRLAFSRLLALPFSCVVCVQRGVCRERWIDFLFVLCCVGRLDVRCFSA
jgi:hypothetical protein